MPKRVAPLLFVVGGAGIGAVIREVVLDASSGPVMPLVAIGATTVLAGFVVGFALAAPRGRLTAFALGLGSSSASLSLYGFLGVTHRVGASAAFLLSVPVLTAISLTLGVISAGVLARSADAAQR